MYLWYKLWTDIGQILYQIRNADSALKSIVTKQMGKKDKDLIKYVKEKMQTQADLISKILDRIESLQSSR